MVSHPHAESALRTIVHRMCGRYTHLFTWAELHRLMSMGEVAADEAAMLRPRYNVAPQQIAPVILVHNAGRKIAFLRWGLIPHWAKDSQFGARTINARSETIADAPSFREPFRRRRCIVPASGFFEWHGKDGRGRKQPWYITPSDPQNQILAMAGVWDEWTSPSGETLRTFSVVTTAANDFMKHIHTRMPVVFTKAQAEAWLEPTTKPEHLTGLLAPCDSRTLKATTVSTKVNSVAFDDPECIRPEAPASAPPGLFGEDHPDLS